MQIANGYTLLKNKAEHIVDSLITSGFLSKRKGIGLSYAYPCENYIGDILSNGLVRQSLQLFTDKYCKKQIHDLKTSAQAVTKSNFPVLYDIFQRCCKSLNAQEIPEVYVTSQLKGINALSIGTDSDPIILISRKAAITLPKGEMKFMIGHELGHILQKNLMCHTIKGLLDNFNSKSEILGPIVSDLIDVPLNQWYRCAEYTADRAGLICSGKIQYATGLFSRLSNNVYKEITQMENFFELNNIHPMYNKRLKQLEQFAAKKNLI